VINSHLNAGASIVLNQSAMVSREFWEILDKHAVSSFAGVPFQYEMLMRLRLHQKKLVSLRYITQAGGRLPEKVCLYLQRFAQNNHVSFYIMYGQTEATARMAFNQIEQGSKLDSIGKAIPNGQFKLIDESGADILEPHINGELCYSGPNIMLGYVEHYSELSTFTPQSWLYTGDVAYFDEDRDFFISGRLKRFVKVFGKRINLDELEQWLNSNDVKCYCIGDDELIQIGVVGIQLDDKLKAIKSKVSAFLNVHHSKVDVRSVDELPIRSNGKKDYKTLACLLENGAVNP
jgi:acyl-coenzyme A synthetase/AMP-(fatty) acid ligase